MSEDTRPKAKIIGTALSFACALAFVSVAIFRRLNFDEWLILRSGWLIAHNIATDLHFLMPFSWLVGAISQQTSDAASPILILRIGTNLLLLGTLQWALYRRIPNFLERHSTFILSVTCGAFLSHAVEFRYDNVIVVCWLWCWSATNQTVNGRTSILLGIVAAVLALHHTKGLFFAISLCLFLFIKLHETPRKLFQFGAGASIALVGWGIFLALNGLFSEQFSVYLQFSALAAQVERISPWVALKNRIVADWTWWALVVPFTAIGVWTQAKTQWVRETLWFLATPAAFITLHPHPWDYMLVPLVPFLSALAINGGSFLLNHISYDKRFPAFLVMIPPILFSGVSAYIIAYQADNFHERELLLWLSEQVKHDDTVIDPTGAAYFIQPFDKQWYLDTLFRTPLEKQRWMQKTVEHGNNATFIIFSYRLFWLPKTTLSNLVATHEPVCGWIWVRKNDPRIPSMKTRCPKGSAAMLENFWGT